MTTLPSKDVKGEGVRDEGRAPAMLVMADTKMQSLSTIPVPSKGTQHPWVAKTCARWIDVLGSSRVSIKSDQEKPIMALAREVARQRREGTETTFVQNEKG